MASLAVSYYCKDSLGLGPASAGLFQTAGQIPWELTPLLGLLTDLVPLWGYRRKAYLLLVGLLGAACWGGLAWLRCTPLLAGALLVGSAAATAWTQVIADAVLVGMSQGRSQDVASFYQALSWGTYTTGAVLSAYTTGRLLDAGGPQPVFALAAGGLLLDGACAALLSEERVAWGAWGRGPPQQQQQAQGQQAPERPLAKGRERGRRARDRAGRAEGGSDEVEQAQALLAGEARDDEAEEEGLPDRISTVPVEVAADCCRSPPPTAPAPANGLGDLQRGEDAVVTSPIEGLILVKPAVGSPPAAATSGFSPESNAGAVEVRHTCAVPPAPSASRGLEQPPPLLLLGSLPSPAGSGAGCGAGGGGGGGGAARRGGARALVRTVWRTLRDPHIAIPALFIFAWQSCPSPTSAMFYFQRDVLHFSAGFQELVYLAGSFAGVAGVLIYQGCLVSSPLRLMLAGCAAVGSALSASQLLLVTRANVALGISDKVFVLGDYAVLSAIAEVMMTPLLALSARVCPPGVEATLYACLYSLLNLSGALSGCLGALLTQLCGVGDGGEASGGPRLTLLVAVCNACMLAPLPLLLLIPSAPPPGVLLEVEGPEEQQLLIPSPVAEAGDDTAAAAAAWPWVQGPKPREGGGLDSGEAGVTMADGDGPAPGLAYAAHGRGQQAVAADLWRQEARLDSQPGVPYVGPSGPGTVSFGPGMGTWPEAGLAPREGGEGAGPGPSSGGAGLAPVSAAAAAMAAAAQRLDAGLARLASAPAPDCVPWQAWAQSAAFPGLDRSPCLGPGPTPGLSPRAAPGATAAAGQLQPRAGGAGPSSSAGGALYRVTSLGSALFPPPPQHHTGPGPGPGPGGRRGATGGGYCTPRQLEPSGSTLRSPLVRPSTPVGGAASALGLAMGRAVGQPALTFVGGAAGAHVGVSPLARLVRARSVAAMLEGMSATAAAGAAGAAAEGAVHDSEC
ncbi:hypothetical protein HYH03_002776 [Edaphochlamys debaryana]|uniref:Uncharacterized protein n=1 Tax=Edaphochlamys debaryana TaxID=47281 RepID=A0A836C3V0_9CHLO|nr:hypothetical protein HYH03_002776 [Edaphochlamys debaryana]|eukprot:KAG2499195.1 hypothetical protein HYH03_002776 [Edaphochlamys debaryana]